MNTIVIPVSAGELVDKITILKIKERRIIDAQMRMHITHELGLLKSELAKVPDSPRLRELAHALRTVNDIIWDAEDAVRSAQDDQAYLAATRTTHTNNDERFRLKRAINELLSSDVVEIKSHKL